MNTDTMNSFLALAYGCAHAMLANGAYITKELPNVELPPGLDVKVNHLCDNLWDTHDDVREEIEEASRLLETSFDEEAIRRKIKLILKWLSETMFEMHGLIVQLRTASLTDKRYDLAVILLEESAANILGQFNVAADELEKEGGQWFPV